MIFHIDHPDAKEAAHRGAARNPRRNGLVRFGLGIDKQVRIRFTGRTQQAGNASQRGLMTRGVIMNFNLDGILGKARIFSQGTVSGTSEATQEHLIIRNGIYNT